MSFVANDADIAAIAGELRLNQRDWDRRGLDYRLAALRELELAFQHYAPEIQEALICDTGRVAASIAEVEALSKLIQRWAGVAPALLRESCAQETSHPNVVALAQRVPYSLVGVITPWNSPLGLALIDAVPALIAGAAVIIKPSEIGDSFIQTVNRAISQVPDLSGVFRFVQGDGYVGTQIVGTVDAVCFTGSVDTGRKVAAQAAERLIPAFLELGGKDPAIVLKGADLDRAAGGIAWSGTFNSGQLCHSIERVYVEASVYEPFIQRLTHAMQAKTLAYPMPEDGELGPFIDPNQAAIVEQQISDALAKGASIRTGGNRITDKGRIWLEPTILENVSHDMDIMTKETFGPVLPVMRVVDQDDAVRLANDCVFGLSASVWGPEETALNVARCVNAGGVSVNDASLAAVLMDAEKNSFGQSGLGGSRMGPAALTRFTRKKALMVSRIEGGNTWW